MNIVQYYCSGARSPHCVVLNNQIN